VASNATTSSNAAEFAYTRVLDPPRAQIFKAFTDVDELKHWWGPRGFQWVSAKLELRPGGVFHYCMRSPQGVDMWGLFVYREVVPSERLVFVNSFSDEKGGVIPNPWIPEMPQEILNVVTFIERDGKTTIHMRGTPINASEAARKLFESSRESMEKGFGGTFQALEEYLATR